MDADFNCDMWGAACKSCTDVTLSGILSSVGGTSDCSCTSSLSGWEDSRPSSSDFTSLIFTGEAFDDMLEDVHAETQELAQCRLLSGAEIWQPQELSAAAQAAMVPDISLRIREDLQKQGEGTHTAACLRKTSSSSPSLCGASPSPSASPSACCCAASTAPLRLPAPHRARIVGWMRQAAEAMGLHLATLFAATSLLDRFVATAEDLPPDSMLQLLALACMSVAVKYEEGGKVQSRPQEGPVPPAVWLGLAVDVAGAPLYAAKDLQRMEWVLLQTTSWRLHTPNTFTFLANYLSCLPNDGAAPAAGAAAAASPADQPSSGAAQGMVRWLPVTRRAVALAEVSLVHKVFLSYDHSAVALACVTLAERMAITAAEPTFNPAAAATLVAAAGVRLEVLAPRLEPCVEALERCYNLWTSQHQQ